MHDVLGKVHEGKKSMLNVDLRDSLVPTRKLLGRE